MSISMEYVIPWWWAVEFKLLQVHISYRNQPSEFLYFWRIYFFRKIRKIYTILVPFFRKFEIISALASANARKTQVLLIKIILNYNFDYLFHNLLWNISIYISSKLWSIILPVTSKVTSPSYFPEKRESWMKLDTNWVLK